MGEILVAVVLGVGSGLLIAWWLSKAAGLKNQAELDAMLADADRERKELLDAAELEAETLRAEAARQNEQLVKEKRAEFIRRERELEAAKRSLDTAQSKLESDKQTLKRRRDTLEREVAETSAALKEANAKLSEAEAERERISGLTRDEALAELRGQLEGRARALASKQVQEIESQVQKEADERARKVVASAIQRLAGGFVAEKAISVVKLPSDEFKGKIIGREGRNIRAIENATGVDIIIDDTPEAVVLSSFNPVRREVARVSLERLIEDGRIHPARIEEVVPQVEEEFATLSTELGEKAMGEAGIRGLKKDLLEILGRMHYRDTDGQNLLKHSIETAKIAGFMAAELGLNVKAARRAGFLHDVGRAVDHNSDGAHWSVSADVAKKYGQSEAVVKAIREHHLTTPSTLLGVVLQVADRLSRERPGARTEGYSEAISRLDDMERLCTKFDGVTRAWAMMAGNEIRVVADYERIDEGGMSLLADDIATSIEENMDYPGEVVVTVIREARVTEIAR